MSFYDLHSTTAFAICKDYFSLCYSCVCRWHFFVFRNFVEKFCVSWAFPLIECVAVWALKNQCHIPTYSKPTRHKVFLRNYWNTKEPAANICHKPILPNSVFLYLINAFRNAFLDAVAAASSPLTTLPFPSKPK